MQDNQTKVGKFQLLQNQVSEQIREKWTNAQLKIREKIIEKDNFHWDMSNLQLVAGVDISALKTDTDIACATLIIYHMNKNEVLYNESQFFDISQQPYIPGFLAFREVPILYALFQRLKQKRPELWPQLLLVDGNGILHPNQCGLACHIGVLLDLPTIGVGKTLFYIDGLGKQSVKQQCQKDIKATGDYSLLKGFSGKIWGAAVRNSANAVNPVFVSIGHRIQLQTAIACVLKLSLFRVVEPIRLADKHSRQMVQKWHGDKTQLPKYPMFFL